MALYAPIPNWHEDTPDITNPAVLKRDIQWETYVNARLISDKDLRSIRLYDKQPAATQDEILKTEGHAVVASLMAVLKTVTKEETVQYVLALFTQMLQVDKDRAVLFFIDDVTSSEPYNTLLRLLQRADWYTQEKACELLTVLLDRRPGKDAQQLQGLAINAASSSTTPGAAASSSVIVSAADSGLVQVVVSFVEWLSSQLRRPTSPTKSVPVAVSALTMLLKEIPVREYFTRTGGVQLLAPLLRMAVSPAPNPQMVYDAALCVWSLSFFPPACHVMQKAGIMSGLVEVVKLATKEKILRVSLYAIKNLLLTEGVVHETDTVENELVKAVAAKRACNFEDTDLTETLDWLGDWLAQNIHQTSSWERYRKELLSGQLTWSPMHQSEKFWRDNVFNFEERDFQMLRVLLKLLEASRDSRTLAVGCYDLGQFVTYFPHGRQMVMDLRGKELVMRLMMHPDPEVQKQALMCVQRILIEGGLDKKQAK